MRNVIINRTGADEAAVIVGVLDMLPYRIADAVRRVIEREERKGYGYVEEIRITTGRAVVIVCRGRNILLDVCADGDEMAELFDRMCGGSLYAHTHSIKNGYITLAGGIRVGVCGRAAVEGDEIFGVYDITTLSIRLPHPTPNIGRTICDLLEDFGYTKGVLIYSPPGVGKTTLLRSVARLLSSGRRSPEKYAESHSPLRVAVIDTRCELAEGLDGERMCIDILRGYPKHTGIEIAARTLSAQVMICDEIGGSEAEAHAIASSQNCGVPLVASAHASDVCSLLRRGSIGILHESGVFGAYVGISRIDGSAEYHYDIHMAEELMSLNKSNAIP